MTVHWLRRRTWDTGAKSVRSGGPVRHGTSVNAVIQGDEATRSYRCEHRAAEGWVSATAGLARAGPDGPGAIGRYTRVVIQGDCAAAINYTRRSIKPPEFGRTAELVRSLGLQWRRRLQLKFCSMMATCVHPSRLPASAVRWILSDQWDCRGAEVCNARGRQGA